MLSNSSGLGPLRSTSSQRRGTIAPEALRAALANLDLTNRTDVADIHRLLAQMPDLERLCVEAFNGMDSERVREAVATLILYGLDDERNEGRLTMAPNLSHVPPPGTPSIAQSRDAARQTLVELLSPAGQAALLQSVGPNAQDDTLFRYLPAPDRLRLAGDVHRQRADSLRNFWPDEPPRADRSTRIDSLMQLAAHLSERADACEQAIALYNAATYAYAQAGQLAHAATSFEAIAEIYRQMGEHELAGDAASQAADTYLKAGLDKEAGAAFWEAGISYDLAELLLKSVEAFENSAEIRQQPQVNQPDEAADALERASRLYELLAEHTQAANTCAKAAALYPQRASGAAKAAPLFGRAAALYLAAGEPRLAAVNFERAAHACLLTNLQDAATYYQEAAIAWLKATGCEELAEVALRQALHYFSADAQNQSEAGKQALAASETAREAGRHGQAVEHQELASRLLAGAARSFEGTANIHRINGHPVPAADDFSTAKAYFVLAAKNAREAGEHARKMGDEARAVDLFNLAGDSLVHVANIELATDQPALDGGAAQTAREDFTKAGDSAFAMGDDLSVRGQHARAVAWYKRAEDAYRRAEEPELAVAAAEAAANSTSHL